MEKAKTEQREQSISTSGGNVAPIPSMGSAAGKEVNALLEEPAKCVVAVLPLASNNYEIAVKLLKDRYGDPAIIQRVHINQLAYLPSVFSDKNLKNYVICMTKLRLIIVDRRQ